MKKLPSPLVFVIVFGVPAFATDWTVSPDGSGDFPTIQAAIDASEQGDVIELTSGVFRGVGNRDLNTLGKAITIRSAGDNPAECVIEPTNGAPPEEDHIAFSIENGEGQATIVRGITISGGDGSLGGACYVHGAAPVFSNCRFVDNFAVYGGAVCCDDTAQPSFVDCLFLNNQAMEMGGAVCCDSYTTVAFDHCAFFGNHAHDGVGIVLAENHDTVEFTNCTFDGNWSFQGLASGFWFDDESTGDFTHCIVTSTFYAGGGYWAFLGTVTLNCCDIWNNEGGDFVGPLDGMEDQNGNFSADPLYCDPQAGDYRIEDVSPCSPQENPECGLIGRYDVGCGTSDAGSDIAGLAGLTLRVPSPIPFGAGSQIHYTVPSAEVGSIRFTIHDVQGRIVGTLVSGAPTEGEHVLTWDGCDDHGHRLGAGTYFCRLRCGRETMVRSIAVVG